VEEAARCDECADIFVWVADEFVGVRAVGFDEFWDEGLGVDFFDPGFFVEEPLAVFGNDEVDLGPGLEDKGEGS